MVSSFLAWNALYDGLIDIAPDIEVYNFYALSPAIFDPVTELNEAEA